MEKWKRNLMIVWSGQVLSQISFGFGLPFMPFFIRELGVTDPDAIKYFTGLLSMAPAVSMAFMAPVWGKLADIYGRKSMMMRAMFSASVLIFLMGLSPNVYVLLLLRTFQGFFTGTVGAANAFIAANAPKEKMSYALGVLSSANFLGFSIGPFLGGIAATYLGFRMSFIIGASVMVLAVLLTGFLLKEDPSTFGRDKVKASQKVGLKEIIGTVGVILLVLMLLRFLRSLFAPFISLYLEELHGPKDILTINGNVAMAVSLVTALAGFILSRLGDRFPKDRLVEILMGITLVLSTALWFNQSFWGFVLLYMAFSFFMGGVEPLLTSLSTERVPPQNRGSLFGYLGLVGGLGWMFAPMAGSIMSVAFGYQSLFLLMTACILLNMIMVFIDRRLMVSK